MSDKRRTKADRKNRTNSEEDDINAQVEQEGNANADQSSQESESSTNGVGVSQTETDDSATGASGQSSEGVPIERNSTSVAVRSRPGERSGGPRILVSQPTADDSEQGASGQSGEEVIPITRVGRGTAVPSRSAEQIVVPTHTQELSRIGTEKYGRSTYSRSSEDVIATGSASLKEALRPRSVEQNIGATRAKERGRIVSKMYDDGTSSHSSEYRTITGSISSGEGVRMPPAEQNIVPTHENQFGRTGPEIYDGGARCRSCEGVSFTESAGRSQAVRFRSRRESGANAKDQRTASQRGRGVTSADSAEFEELEELVLIRQRERPVIPTPAWILVNQTGTYDNRPGTSSQSYNYFISAGNVSSWEAARFVRSEPSTFALPGGASPTQVIELPPLMPSSRPAEIPPRPSTSALPDEASPVPVRSSARPNTVRFSVPNLVNIEGEAIPDQIWRQAICYWFCIFLIALITKIIFMIFLTNFIVDMQIGRSESPILRDGSIMLISGIALVSEIIWFICEVKNAFSPPRY